MDVDTTTYADDEVEPEREAATLHCGICQREVSTLDQAGRCIGCERLGALFGALPASHAAA